VANIDLIVIVASGAVPVTDPFLIDRMAAMAEWKGCDVLICFNKCDLDRAEELVELYRGAGFHTIQVSAETGDGVEELAKELYGKVSAFTGNTGVGKSTLLNHISSNLEIKTGEISKKLGRGRHTTRSVELYKLDNGGYIADTPGFSTFETQKYDIIRKEELLSCFPEFRDYEGKCRFPDCAHIKEKGCAVLEAVRNGQLAASRHNSYTEMYEEARQIKEWELKR